MRIIAPNERVQVHQLSAIAPNARKRSCRAAQLRRMPESHAEPPLFALSAGKETCAVIVHSYIVGQRCCAKRPEGPPLSGFG